MNDPDWWWFWCSRIFVYLTPELLGKHRRRWQKSPKKVNKTSTKRKSTPKGKAPKKQVILAARTRLEPRLSLPPLKSTNEEDTNIDKNKTLPISPNTNEGTPKEKSEKPASFVARARLEPHLNLPSNKKRKKETDGNIEKGKRLVVSLNAKEVDAYCNAIVVSQKLPSTSRNHEIVKASNENNSKSSKISLKNAQNLFEDEEDYQNFFKESKAQTKGTKYWTDTEVRDLAYALQCHGFSDMDKLAAEVKTKSANEIRRFLKDRELESRKTIPKPVQSDKQRGRPKNTWTTVCSETLKTWPAVRKWRRLAYQQMLSCTRTKEYSAPVISALCNRFYEEEPEPADPQVINVKLIYKYMSDCMAGVIPPQLPPKESALVLDLLREVHSLHIANDFEEERQFLRDYKKATNFKPFEVKDEFKKKFKKDSDEANDPNTVSVPEEIFLQLSKHKKVLQSFNPLITPVWMLQKEQEYLEKHLEESCVIIT